MLIEPMEPLRVRLPEGECSLEAGRIYDLPVLQAQKLLIKAAGKVRVIKQEQSEALPIEQVAFHVNANLSHMKVAGGQDVYPVGSKITYRSPLFGFLEAEVLDDRGEIVWIWHPIRQCEACIPRSWIDEAS